jgi:hypothetical protein
MECNDVRFMSLVSLQHLSFSSQSCLDRSERYIANLSLYIERWKGICKQHGFFSMALAWRVYGSLALIH